MFTLYILGFGPDDGVHGDPRFSVLVSMYNGTVSMHKLDDINGRRPVLNIDLNAIGHSVGSRMDNECDSKMERPSVFDEERKYDDAANSENALIDGVVVDDDEAVIAESIATVDFEDERRGDTLCIGTRSGWLALCDLRSVMEQDSASWDVRRIGDVPVSVVPIKVPPLNEDGDGDDGDFCGFGSSNALLCLSDRCWLLFLDDAHRLRLWPLNYPLNAVSLALSIHRMFSPQKMEWIFIECAHRHKLRERV